MRLLHKIFYNIKTLTELWGVVKGWKYLNQTAKSVFFFYFMHSQCSFHIYIECQKAVEGLRQLMERKEGKRRRERKGGTFAWAVKLARCRATPVPGLPHFDQSTKKLYVAHAQYSSSGTLLRFQMPSRFYRSVHSIYTFINSFASTTYNLLFFFIFYLLLLMYHCVFFILY